MRDCAQIPIVVLVVDDQAFIATAIRQLLASEPDIELHHCSRALDAVAVANLTEVLTLEPDCSSWVLSCPSGRVMARRRK